MKDFIVIKIGGVAAQQLSIGFLSQIKDWQDAGKHLVIVHGGGFAINRLMEENKVSIKKVKGLRVTSQSDMKLVSQALLDIVGKDLSEKLTQSGLANLQLTSQLRQLIRADFLDKDTYGYVGEVTSIQRAPVLEVLNEGKIPLLASLGYSKEGDMLNINADYLATATAAALAAEKLILLTDVKGVLENGQVLPELTVDQIPKRIISGVITGGMIPKIESAAKTVELGVAQVLIGDGLTEGTLIHKG